MNQKTKLIAGLLALVVVLAGAAFAYNRLAAGRAPTVPVASAPASAPQSAAGADSTGGAGRQKAPDFTVVDAEGNEHRLSDFEGKPVVLNFWASWCPPCKREMPVIEQVYTELGEEVHFLMVDLVDGGRETVESGAAFVADAGYTFPVYYDTGQAAAIAYGVYSIPSTLFIDSEGYVVTSWLGEMDEDTLRGGIEASMAAV